MPTSTAARDLSEWFNGILQYCDATVFAVSDEEAHREAAIYTVLQRNAKIFVGSAIDTGGELYQPLCLILASGVRRLHVEVREGHWQSAIANAVKVGQQPREPALLSLGSPARMFKDQVDESLIQAGATDQPTILTAENRRTALALGINWSLRFLIAYAFESRGLKRRPKVHDLAWIKTILP